MNVKHGATSENRDGLCEGLIRNQITGAPGWLLVEPLHSAWVMILGS